MRKKDTAGAADTPATRRLPGRQSSPESDDSRLLGIVIARKRRSSPHSRRHPHRASIGPPLPHPKHDFPPPTSAKNMHRMTEARQKCHQLTGATGKPGQSPELNSAIASDAPPQPGAVRLPEAQANCRTAKSPPTCFSPLAILSSPPPPPADTESPRFAPRTAPPARRTSLPRPHGTPESPPPAAPAPTGSHAADARRPGTPA
jgi:hypothetical protein